MDTTTLRSDKTNILTGLSQTQRDRLAHIEFRLYFLGEVGRADLIRRFGIAPAVATRDFALYRSAFESNITFNRVSKTYIIGEHFSPAFQHIPDRVLTALTEGFGDGVTPTEGSLIPCESAISLNRPRIDVLAPVTRAIFGKRAVRLTYTSHTSGTATREIVPFALATDGLRWHARAFCRRHGDFRDFVISRMENTEVILDRPIDKNELPDRDHQWNRIVDLEIVPHPDRTHPEITENDFGMKNGQMKLSLRAALAGYVLRQWHVDCTQNHTLKDNAYRLWLKNTLALYGVETALLAPGYIPPN